MAALLKGNIFVYEGHWGIDKNAVCFQPPSIHVLTQLYQEPAWVVVKRTVYLNPAIIDTIKTAWFISERTLGNQYLEAYVSSVPERPDEKEFTIPLVALAITGVRPFTFTYVQLGAFVFKLICRCTPQSPAGRLEFLKQRPNGSKASWYRPLTSCSHSRSSSSRPPSRSSFIVSCR